MTRNFLVLFFVLLGVGCTPQCEKNQFEPSKPINHPIPEFKVEELNNGSGSKLKPGDTVEIHYQAWIFEEGRSGHKGLMFKDTLANGTPLKIVWGQTELIEGWQQGLKDMRQGGKRRIFIPSTMAYGDEGAGLKVPKGAHLIYEISVESVQSAKSPEDPSGTKAEESSPN